MSEGSTGSHRQAAAVSAVLGIACKVSLLFQVVTNALGAPVHVSSITPDLGY